ncbi:YugN-like family protein [Lentibacillus persicus]|uniref:YugN-like family protein n=1 Tax=Lentibacillus persicus TaxID=640948 RepID=A0A1I1WFB0_9BACI|nr:YugN family protein [Lentibacillus persicus]SFD93866.1 YugN-like family protein [Lentibacillus persicus]
MIQLNSTIENNIYPLFVLEERLKPGGNVRAVNWDYASKFVQLVIEERGAHYVLKIPFYAVKGSLNYPGITVRVDRPLLEYTPKNNREREGAAWTADTINEPSLNSADHLAGLQMTGEHIMQKIEQLLLPG